MAPKLTKRDVLIAGKERTCDRCGKKPSATIMSKFNKDIICVACSVEEQNRPDYVEACKAEGAAYKAGIEDFEGIGLRWAEGHEL